MSQEIEPYQASDVAQRQNLYELSQPAHIKQIDADLRRLWIPE